MYIYYNSDYIAVSYWLNHVRKCISLFTSVRCVRVRVLPIHLSPRLSTDPRSNSVKQVYISASLSLYTAGWKSSKASLPYGPGGPPSRSITRHHTPDKPKNHAFLPHPLISAIWQPRQALPKLFTCSAKAAKKTNFSWFVQGWPPSGWRSLSRSFTPQS